METNNTQRSAALVQKTMSALPMVKDSSITPTRGNQYVSEKENTEDLFAKAYGFYRFHIPDPVYFYKDVLVTIQNMGGCSYEQMLKALEKDPSLKFMKAGDGTEYHTREIMEAAPNIGVKSERSDDYCATAYWYMDSKENGLGPIADVAERSKDLP